MFHFSGGACFKSETETKETAETANREVGGRLRRFRKVKQAESETESETKSETAVTPSFLHIYTFLSPLLFQMFHFFMENRNIKEIGKEGKRPPGTNEGRAPIWNLDTRPYGRKNETYLMGGGCWVLEGFVVFLE